MRTAPQASINFNHPFEWKKKNIPTTYSVRLVLLLSEYEHHNSTVNQGELKTVDTMQHVLPFRLVCRLVNFALMPARRWSFCTFFRKNLPSGTIVGSRYAFHKKVESERIVSPDVLTSVNLLDVSINLRSKGLEVEGRSDPVVYASALTPENLNNII